MSIDRRIALAEPTVMYHGMNGLDPSDPAYWGGFGPSILPSTPKAKVGDVLKVVCKKCGNEGHVKVCKLESGKVHATCKLCGKEVVQ